MRTSNSGTAGSWSPREALAEASCVVRASRTVGRSGGRSPVSGETHSPPGTEAAESRGPDTLRRSGETCTHATIAAPAQHPARRARTALGGTDTENSSSVADVRESDRLYQIELGLEAAEQGEDRFVHHIPARGRVQPAERPATDPPARVV